VPDEPKVSTPGRERAMAMSSCDQARRSGAIFDDNGLAEHLGHSLRDGARKHVHIRSGRKSEHETQRLGRIR
jgi:hypothetical protein